MDERLLFDKFHEALDVDPRPAAYERLRSALIAKTSTPRRRAAFQMRWTRMGFRLAAAIVLVAVAVTAGAVFFATHRVADNNVPAGLDANTVAYQKMVSDDDQRVAASTSNHCGQITDTGCAAAVAQVNATLQHWLDDLGRFNTPAEFKVADAQLRVHIAAGISDLNTCVTAVNQQRQDLLTAALNAAVNERGWIDTMVGSVKNRHGASQAVYSQLVKSERTAIDACPECAEAASQGQLPCDTSTLLSCQAFMGTVEDAIQGFQVGLVLYAPPASLRNRDAQLQTDLASASSTAVTMVNATLAGDRAGFDSARQTLRQTLAAVDRDCGAVLAT